MEEDKKFMQEALALAKDALLKAEVPVAALLVKDGKIIASAHNLVESLQDATCHAELLCIQKAAKHLQNWRLVGCTLYSTLEPCIMCASAIMQARISRVVWGAPDKRLGGFGSFINVVENHPMHTIEIGDQVLQEESAQLLRSFFQLRRENKKQRVMNRGRCICAND